MIIYYTILYFLYHYTILYYTILYTILHSIILCYKTIIINYIILYYTTSPPNCLTACRCRRLRACFCRCTSCGIEFTSKRPKLPASPLPPSEAAQAMQPIPQLLSSSTRDASQVPKLGLPGTRGSFAPHRFSCFANWHRAQLSGCWCAKKCLYLSNIEIFLL